MSSKLRDPEILRQLGGVLPQLECVSLAGNPIAKHPNYKMYLVAYLPRLRSLDGKVVSVTKTDLEGKLLFYQTISAEVRVECESKLLLQTQLLQLMLKNHSEIQNLSTVREIR